MESDLGKMGKDSFIKIDQKFLPFSLPLIEDEEIQEVYF